jgi:superfamily II DNA or RNA helicase
MDKKQEKNSVDPYIDYPKRGGAKIQSLQKTPFMFYPEIKDNDFYEKIYLKKEFRDNEIKEKKDLLTSIQTKKEFILEPHQNFLKNYISPDTPYNGILIFHGTGVGKTCTAISIAEGFKKTLKNINKKILIISTLRQNFIKEIYNFDKELNKTNPEDMVQCTGKAYDLGIESEYLSVSQKEREVRKIIKSYYQFVGYKKFANDIINITDGWDGDEKKINEKIKKFISREFDDRVIIIDEIQNIKTDRKEDYTKSIQPILKAIIKYGKNIKLILMSATPMFDRPDEIIFYINLLLMNDGRKTINKSEIFNSKDGTLKENSEQILKEMFKGYISFIRAEKPFIFPFRVYPKKSEIPRIVYNMSGLKIDPDTKIKFTKLIMCQMNSVQENTYLHFYNKIKQTKKIKNYENSLNKEIENNEKKNINELNNLIKISNIVYPQLNFLRSSDSNSESNNNIELTSISNIGAFGKSSIETDYDSGYGGYYKITKIESSKKTIQYKYQSHAIFDKDTVNEAPFADEKYLSNYSTKFADILNNIKNSKGTVFIFSHYIEQGTLPLALMLEQNGFDRECTDGEINLLNYSANKFGKGGKKRPICYKCGKEASYYQHNDEKSNDYHLFKRAKYILFFGENRDIIKIKKEDAVKKFINKNNKYGEEIKVFIGTKTVSEGLDFKRIRQVHILEPWYNLSRHEQIIGRAIRNLSHDDLLPHERNVEIYQYAAILNSKKNKNGLHETIDLRNYFIAESKDIIIKNITRIMKESAVDCFLFKNSNIVDDNRVTKQITASGEILNIPVADKPYSPMCDYKKNCKYICNWEPNPRIKYPINTDTYNITFALNDIDIAKKFIKKLFHQNIVFELKTIEYLVLGKYPELDKLFIYSALEDLVDNKNEIIFDKFSRKGYIIYRGDYYIFQPFDLERDDIPLIYRMYPSNIKYKHVDLENIDIDYKNNSMNFIKDEINSEKFTENIIKKIDNLIELHKQVYLFNKDEIFYDKYCLSVIGLVVDKLQFNEKSIFISTILTRYLLENKEKKKDHDLFLHIIKYLDINNFFIEYYKDILANKSKSSKNIFIGYIINKEYFIIDKICEDKNLKFNKIDFTKLKKINFINCTKELIKKIKFYKDMEKKRQNKDKNKEYNVIYGIIEINKKNKLKKFKIIDKSSEEEIYTKEKAKSKRSIITGRMCSSFQFNTLLELRDKIGMYKITDKKMIKYICNDIEIYLRYKNFINSNNKIWFEIIND